MTVEWLYKEYYDLLKNFAISLAREENDAEDLVQDTFMRALINFQLLNMMPDYKIKSWMFTVLKNLFIDKIRRTKLQQVYNEQAPYPEYYEIFMMTEDEIPMEVLPDILQEIVYKRYWLGMNSKEIGQELDMPASTVRYKLSEAIKILRKNIE